MKISKLLTLAFWMLSLTLQPLTALGMILHRQVKSFPLFFAYILFVAGRDLALLFIPYNTKLYARIYFGGEPVSILLGLAAICEVFWYLIRPYPMLRRFGIPFFWVNLGTLVVMAYLMLRTSEFKGQIVSTESIVLLERSARFIQVGVLVLFILFISRFGLTWKYHVAGIVTGFGLAAGLQLGLLELRSLSVLQDRTFALLKPAAYDCGVVVWALYFVGKRAPETPAAPLPENQLAKWDELLRRYLRK